MKYIAAIIASIIFVAMMIFGATVGENHVEEPTQVETVMGVDLSYANYR